MNGKTIAFVAALSLFALAVAVVLLPDVGELRPVQFVLGTGTVASLVRVLYDGWDWFYFNVTRTWLWITNASSSWSLQVEFEGGFTHASLTQARSLFENAYPGRASTWSRDRHLDPNELVLRLPGYAARIRISHVADDLEGEGPALLVIDLSEFEVPFRSSISKIDEVSALLGGLQRELSPRGARFTFEVRFQGPNPFLGLFLRRLHLPSTLTTLQINLQERIAGASQVAVEIGREIVRLTTDDLIALRTSSRKYLTLATAPFSPG